MIRTARFGEPLLLVVANDTALWFVAAGRCRVRDRCANETRRTLEHHLGSFENPRAQFFNTVIVSLTFEYMINSSLEVHGSLWYFAGLTFLGLIFVLVFLRETRGLTDKEMKSLYSPKATEDIDKLILELQATSKSK